MEQESKIIGSCTMLFAPYSALNCGDLAGVGKCLKRIF
jgi:hypothetical protein